MTLPFGWPLVRLDETGTTMDDALALARMGARHGTTVVAGVQTAGRGRSDRRWETPPGTALLMSVILRPGLPMHALSPLSMLAALAVRETALAFGVPDGDIRIKWPNDVLIQGRKVCGILARTHRLVSGESPEVAVVVVLGIGLNVNVPMEVLPESGISLSGVLGRKLDLDAVREVLLGSLDRGVQALIADDLDGPLTALDLVLAYRSEPVDVQDGDRTVSGVLLGVERTGALVLEVAGRRETIVSGDLTRGPRPHR
ncbi:MAG: biotin--[acetyl-CoA-carboxylase] ligase [Thermomicrobiales bacterium]